MIESTLHKTIEYEWIDILEKSNFEIVDIVPDDSDMLSVLQQKLIIGRK